MRIGIDARLIAYRRGMGNFVYNLLTELAKLPGDEQYVLYVDKKQTEEFAPHYPRFTVRKLAPEAYPLWEQISLPLAVARDNLDILHCPVNTAPLWIPRNCKLVLTIHDVMYLLPAEQLPPSPSFYQRLGRIYRLFLVPRIAQRAEVVVTVSYCSRQDIIKYITLPENRIYVVQGASGRVYRPVENTVALESVRKKYTLDHPFILALAGVDPRKNTSRLIEAFAKILIETNRPYQLAMIGLPSSARHRFFQEARNLGIDNQIVFSGFVPEDDLVALYNLAEVFVYPSLYEGFGLPILEAMACGTPVVTSPRGSIPEVAGDAVIFVDPLSAKAISHGIKKVLTDHELARRLREKGFERVKSFSWRNAAIKMLQIYRKVGQS